MGRLLAASDAPGLGPCCVTVSTEAVWVPVWQRACLWRACGFVEEWERSPADRFFYSFLHLFSGAPAKFVLHTKSLLLAAAHNDSWSQLDQVPGPGFANLTTPVSSLVAVSRASGLYLLVACDSDGSSTALSASASLVHSLVYRSPCLRCDPSASCVCTHLGALVLPPSAPNATDILTCPASIEWREAAAAMACICSWRSRSRRAALASGRLFDSSYLARCSCVGPGDSRAC